MIRQAQNLEEHFGRLIATHRAMSSQRIGPLTLFGCVDAVFTETPSIVNPGFFRTELLTEQSTNYACAAGRHFWRLGGNPFRGLPLQCPFLQNGKVFCDALPLHRVPKRKFELVS